MTNMRTAGPASSPRAGQSSAPATGTARTTQATPDPIRIDPWLEDDLDRMLVQYLRREIRFQDLPSCIAAFVAIPDNATVAALATARAEVEQLRERAAELEKECDHWYRLAGQVRADRQGAAADYLIELDRIQAARRAGVRR